MGVVHRDMKLENVLITSHNVLKVADFGLALLLENGQTSQERVGTLAYAAPEILQGNKY